jgi:hypothetical protein
MRDLPELQQLLSQTPVTLRALAGRLPAAMLEFHEAPGAWSPFEVLCHVTDVETASWIPRVQMILSDNPSRPFAPLDREAGFERFRGWTAGRVLDEFERLRRGNVEALAALKLSPLDLDRTGTHPELGAVALRQLLSTWLTHDYAHVAQIARALVRCHREDVGPWAKYFSLLAS